MTKIISLCRACLCDTNVHLEDRLQSYKIFETEGLADKFRQCSNIEMHPDDGYPPVLCEKCYVTIVEILEFQKMCRSSLQKLKNILEDRAIVKYGNSENETNTVHQLNLESRVHVKCMYMSIPEYNTEVKCQTKSKVKILQDPLTVKNDYEGFVLKSVIDTQSNIETLAQQGKKTKYKEREDEHENGSLFSRLMESPTGSKIQDENSNEDDDAPEDFLSDTNSNCQTKTDKKYRCDLCPQVFILRHRLDAHKRRHQGLREYPCTRENCDRAYRRLCELRQHLNEHDGISPDKYKCDVESCDYQSKWKSAVRMHNRKCHSNNPPPKPEYHICETCGALLASKGSLTSHRLSHIDKSKWRFVCDEKDCSKRFKMQYQLIIHKKRHAGVKDYSCSHCDMKFVTKTNMQNHMRCHTKKRSWPCHMCDQVFSTPAALSNHIQTQHGFKPSAQDISVKCYTCSFCDRVFNELRTKQYHERIHTGEKPHVCEDCGKKFRHPTSLNMHKKTHTKDGNNAHVERKRICRICDRTFASSQVLKYHQTKHTKEKPYKCEECGFTFRWPNNLTRHQKLHLRDKMTEIRKE